VGIYATKPDPHAHWQKSVTLNRLGRLDEAIASLRRAIDLGPRLAFAHKSLAISLLMERRYSDAAEVLEHAIAVNHDDAKLYLGKGLAMRGLGNADAELAALDKAVSLDPNLDRGIALGLMGRHEDALAAFEEAITIEPGNARAHMKKAGALHVLGRHGEALESCRRATDLDPNNPSAHRTNADILGSLGRHGDALESIDRAISLSGNNASLHVVRGHILGTLGRTADALAAHGEAVRLDPAMSRLVPKS